MTKTLEGAYFRGLDLIDATVKNLRPKARRKELLRAREQFSEMAEARGGDDKLEDYFMAFAILARLGSDTGRPKLSSNDLH